MNAQTATYRLLDKIIENFLQFLKLAKKCFVVDIGPYLKRAFQKTAKTAKR